MNGTKLPFDVGAMLALIEVAVRPYPRAALNELAEDGFGAPFEVLIACMISIRTRDEATVAIARGLFARARLPEQVAALPEGELDALIARSSFHAAKARQMRTIARLVQAEFGGQVPCDFDTLVSFPGVGPKCANLVLGIACGQATVSVDVHVHRVTNRWGLVRTKTPEQSMVALERQVPRALWLDVNRLLVPFGKHICNGYRPYCSTCPILVYCRQVGVTAHR
ncbi:MAG: endonuclease III domain-containing protein [Chloroflexota bacterium]